MNLKNLIDPKVVKLGFKTAGTALRQNSPLILSGMAIGGVVATVIFAVKATPKAMKKIDKAKEEKGSDLTVLETVEAAATSYIVPTVMGTVTIGCIIGANTVNSRRLAALAGLYSVTETALNEYKTAAGEIHSTDNPDHTLRDEVQRKIYEDELRKHPVDRATIINTGNGSDLCYDVYSGNHFYSSENAIKAAMNEVNAALLQGEMYMSLNDFYEHLGIPANRAGYDVGFTVDHLVQINTDKTQMTSDRHPCIVMDYVEYPIANYNKLY